MHFTHNPLERGFEKLYSPFQKFIQDQTTSNLILIIIVLIALIIAYVPLSEHY